MQPQAGGDGQTDGGGQTDTSSLQSGQSRLQQTALLHPPGEQSCSEASYNNIPHGEGC